MTKAKVLFSDPDVTGPAPSQVPAAVPLWYDRRNLESKPSKPFLPKVASVRCFITATGKETKRTVFIIKEMMYQQPKITMVTWRKNFVKWLENRIALEDEFSDNNPVLHDKSPYSQWAI